MMGMDSTKSTWSPTWVFVFTVFLAFGLGVLQGSFEVAWKFPGTPPDLLLLFVLWLAIRGQTSCALLAGFIGGITQDAVFIEGPIGIHALAKVLIAYLPEWSYSILVPGTRTTTLLLVISATLIQEILCLALMQTFEPGDIWGFTAAWMALVRLLWNGVVALIVFTPFHPSSSVTS
jgi:rod shape-determining protein MreD